MLFEKWLGGRAQCQAEKPLRPGGLDAFLAAWTRSVARYSKQQSGPSQTLLQATRPGVMASMVLLGAGKVAAGGPATPAGRL